VVVDGVLDGTHVDHPTVFSVIIAGFGALE